MKDIVVDPKHMTHSNYSSITKHEIFNRDNYLFIKNFCDVSSLTTLPPKERGILAYRNSLNDYYHQPLEPQVPDSLGRHDYPPHKKLYYEVKDKLELLLGEELYTTYRYDRFYFAGQKLIPHQDRDCCEISVTIHVSTNLTRKKWPFYVLTPYEETHSMVFSPGDAAIYRGCDVIHWRNELPSRYNRAQRIFRKIMRKSDDTYYHQIFFHYVLANGYRVFSTNLNSI